MQAVLLPDTSSIVNVASVPQRSPFRYPGGKTWFVPHLRDWLQSFRKRASVFVEPFAGGGIASLTVAMENLAYRVVMAVLDSNVAAFCVDRPLTASCKSAGSRLYLHSSINHESLFDLLERVAGEVMLTYDDANEVRDLATAHGFFIKPIPMKTTHHTQTYELAITNRSFATPNAT